VAEIRERGRRGHDGACTFVGARYVGGGRDRAGAGRDLRTLSGERGRNHLLQRISGERGAYDGGRDGAGEWMAGCVRRGGRRDDQRGWAGGGEDDAAAVAADASRARASRAKAWSALAGAR
jgi:hypothetical protein